jgi:hypothetical protein
MIHPVYASEVCGDIYPPGANDCGDGVVDIFDILEEVDISLGIGTHSDSQMTKGDVPTCTPPECISPDGVIDIFDVIGIIDVALEGDNCCRSDPESGYISTPIFGAGECDVTLIVGESYSPPGDEDIEVAVNLENLNNEVRGIQVDICDETD